MLDGMYRVCPHIAVSSGDLPGLEIEARARGVKDLPLGKLRHLAKCLSVYDDLKQPVVRHLAERTIGDFDRSRPRPLSDEDIERHYKETFREFGLPRRL